MQQFSSCWYYIWSPQVFGGAKYDTNWLAFGCRRGEERGKERSCRLLGWGGVGIGCLKGAFQNKEGAQEICT